MHRNTPILAVLVAMAVVFLAAVAQAQPADRAPQLDEELAKGIERAVAYIAVEYQKPNSTRRYIESGTGFFVTPSHLITNHHVIAPALTSDGRINVRLFSGSRETVLLKAEVAKSDPKADLALLQVQGELPQITPVRIDPELPGRQIEVFGFGFPLGTMLDRSVDGPNVCLRRGYVSRLINDGRSIEADMNIDKGISGGPLVDEAGVVRGVVRAMTGSDYNKNFAAISIAAPVLLDFCRAGGLAVTLKDGSVPEPQEQPAMTQTQPAQDMRPQASAGFSQDVLRTFFTLGSALRLTTLVPGMLTLDRADYTPGLRETSRSNADLVLTNLQRANAPATLIQRARELSVLLADARTIPATVKVRSEGLEQECDDWAAGAASEEKLNYDFGAWLTELSLGLIKSHNGADSRACEYFLARAREAGATRELLQLLSRLQSSLTDYGRSPGAQTRRAVARDADKLIAIGYFAIGSVITPGQAAPRNQIQPL